MTNLTHQTFSNNDVEVIINTATGESFCSVSGYVRLSGKSRATIQERISKGVGKTLTNIVKIQTPGGIQSVSLISEELIVEWIIKDNPEVAKKFLQAGVRLFLHQLAGYNYNSVQPQKTIPQYVEPEIQYYVDLIDKFSDDKELSKLLRDKLVDYLKSELDVKQTKKNQSEKKSGNSNTEPTLKSLILCQLKERGTATIKELSDVLGKTENTIRTILSRLKADGLVKRRGSKEDKRCAAWTPTLD